MDQQPSSTAAHRPPLVFIGIAGVVIVVLGGFVVGLLAHGEPFGLDQQWHDFLAAHQTPVLYGISYALNVVGGTFWMTVVISMIVLILLVLRRFSAALTVAASVALASGVCSLIKLAVGRPRPPDATIDVVSDSYPSGHVTTAAALACALVLLYPRVWTWALASVWVIAMALSRTYLLVHWASDVVAGAVLGVSVALVAFGAIKWLAGRAPFLKEHSPERLVVGG